MLAISSTFNRNTCFLCYSYILSPRLDCHGVWAAISGCMQTRNTFSTTAKVGIRESISLQSGVICEFTRPILWITSKSDIDQFNQHHIPHPPDTHLQEYRTVCLRHRRRRFGGWEPFPVGSELNPPTHLSVVDPHPPRESTESLRAGVSGSSFTN